MVTVQVDYDSSRKKGILITSILSNIREYFSVEDKQQVFKRRYAIGYRPQTRIYAITPQGRFEPRLLPELLRYFKDLHLTGVNTTITYSPEFFENTKIESVVSPLSILNIPLRDYQKEAAENALTKGSGIILLPTSAGKTLVIATICQTFQSIKPYKTLILVPDIQLVQQTYSDFLEYGVDEDIVTRWTGTHEPNLDKPVIIANSQILLSKKQDISILKSVDVLIIDEVHKCKAGNSINSVIRQIPAKHRFGFTGTLPVCQMDKWNLTGLIGDVIYQKKSHELREQKFISKVNIGVININHKDLPNFTQATMFNPTVEYEEEIKFLQENSFRNNTIAKLVQKLDKNSLIMVDRINHGEHLLKVLQEKITDKRICFVQGSVEIEEREKIRQLMETSDNVVCIAISKIFSTGINIKNLHYVVFAAIGKAKIKIIQSIGRSLRLHANKKTAYIIDIADNLKYSNSHLQERLKLYDGESIQYTIKTIKEN